MGAVELTRTLPGPETVPLPPRDRSEERARCDRLRARIVEFRRSLGASPAATAFSARISLDEVNETLRLMELRAAQWFKRRQELLEQCAQLDATLSHLSSYRELDLPLDGLDRFAFLHFVAGSLPVENWERIQSPPGEPVALLPLTVQDGRQPLIAMTTHRGWPAVEAVLREAGFEAQTLPLGEGATAAALSERSRREYELSAKELDGVYDAIAHLAGEFAAPLQAMERAVDAEQRLIDAESNFPRTDTVVMLSGWVPAGTVPVLEERLRQITSGRCVLEVGVAGARAGEPVPVLMRHPRWLRPFERLVVAYGLPDYHELQPTLFVALSFLLMFGMMFGDLGHGAVLALGGLLLWRVGGGGRAEGREEHSRTSLGRPTLNNRHRTGSEGSVRRRPGGARTVRDAGVLLMAGGLSSMGFGWIYGSCFGLEYLQTPRALA